MRVGPARRAASLKIASADEVLAMTFPPVLANATCWCSLVFLGSWCAAPPCSVGADEATTVTARAVQILQAGVRSEDFWPSIHAAEALTQAGRGELVRQLLRPKLAAETDAQRRCGLARELVRAGDDFRADVMLGILAGKDPHGHVHAAESLYKVGRIGDGSALRRAITDDNLTLQVMAAAALAKCGSPAAFTRIRQLLNDQQQPESVRRLAAWVLGRIGGPEDRPGIQRLLDAATEQLTKAFAVNSLAALGDAEARAQLLKNLRSSDAPTRTYAAVFAGELRLQEARDALVAMLDDDQEDARYRAAQALVLLGQPLPEPLAEQTQLLFAATPTHPRYTEGSLIVLDDGSYLLAVTEFHNSGSDFAQAQIVARRSRDGGKRWETPVVLQENTGKKNVMSVTLRRLLRDSATGRQQVAMFYLQKDGFNDLKLKLRWLTDAETLEFSEPTVVTGTPGYHVVNNDRVVQLSSGRILVPAASTADVQKVNHFTSRCFLSDDGGSSWRPGKGAVDVARRGAMEPEVIELADGRLMMIVRTQLGAIWHAYSEDRGDTWSAPASLGVRAPEAPATLRRIPATGDLLLIWNDTYTAGAGHGGKRTPLSVALSRDEGKTWKKVRDLETDPERTFSYISAAFHGPRLLLSYWDSSSGRYSTRFRSLPVAELYRQTP